MGFRLKHFSTASQHELLQSRATHDVECSGDVLRLLEACPDLDRLSSRGEDGSRWLPYWAALALGLPLVGLASMVCLGLSSSESSKLC